MVVAVERTEVQSWMDNCQALHNRILELEQALRWILEHPDQVSPEAEQQARAAMVRDPKKVLHGKQG